MSPLATQFPRWDILEPCFTLSTPLSHTSNWSLSLGGFNLANTPRMCFLFSTHSASRFIFLKHTFGDVIKSFTCLHLQVPGGDQGRAFHRLLSVPLLSSGLQHQTASPWGEPLLLWGEGLHFPASGPLLLHFPRTHCSSSPPSHLLKYHSSFRHNPNASSFAKAGLTSQGDGAAPSCPS